MKRIFGLEGGGVVLSGSVFRSFCEVINISPLVRKSALMENGRKIASGEEEG